jgi:hypothetical protein
MTRGRQPTKALAEATAIGTRRGSVLRAPGQRYDMFDLMIFETYRIVFVKVKRSLSQFADPIEIFRTYRSDIARIHRVPLTTISAREIWIRLPRGEWQYFLVRHDSVVEIQADGTHISRMELPIPVPGPEPEEGPLGEDPSGADSPGGDSPTEDGE